MRLWDTHRVRSEDLKAYKGRHVRTRFLHFMKAHGYTSQTVYGTCTPQGKWIPLLCPRWDTVDGREVAYEEFHLREGTDPERAYKLASSGLAHARARSTD